MLRAALSLLAPLVIAVALVVAASVQFARPSDIQAAAEQVLAVARSGDLVLLHPADRTLDLRHFDGVDAISAGSVPPELDRYQRVALVRTRSDAPPSIRRLIVSRGSLLSTRDIGNVTVDWIQLGPPPTLVRDLTNDIEQATVYVMQDGERADCPWEVDRFACLDAPWTYVGATQQTFEGEPHRCIWAHPIEDATLHIELPPAPGADRLVGWYGLTDYAVSIPDGGPVTMRVDNGARARTVRVRQIRGRLPFDTRVGEDGTVTLQISARQPGVRHLCFDIQAVRDGDATDPAATGHADAEGSGAPTRRALGNPPTRIERFRRPSFEAGPGRDTGTAEAGAAAGDAE